MKTIALVMFLVGFVSIGAGIAMPLVDSALTQPQVIHSSGYIVCSSGEPKPAENNSKMLVDTTSFLPIDELGFSACYVKDLDGKLSFVCSRYVAKSDGHVSEDFVSKKLIPK